MPRRRVLRLAALLLALFVAGVAEASLRKLAPGAQVELEPDQGLLLIAADSSSRLDFLRLRREGSRLGSSSLASLDPGVSWQLYVADAGRYHWDLLRSDGKQFTLEGSKFGFEVLPGRINYPGHLVHRPTGVFSSIINLANRGLTAIDWLADAQPALASRYPFAYAGEFPDPFPEYYRKTLGDRAFAEPDPPALPATGDLPLPIRTLWRPGQVGQVSLAPGGRILAMVFREGEEAQPQWVVELFDLEAERSFRALVAPQPIKSLAWSGADALVVSVGEPQNLDLVAVLRMKADASGKRTLERVNVPRVGTLVDALPGDPDHILFSTLVPRNGRFLNLVYRLDIRSQQALDRFGFKRRNALNREIVDAGAWFADARGELRAALARREDDVVILHGRDGQFEEVFRFGEDEEFRPIRLSADGSRIFGLTDKDRGQTELVEFDPAARALVGTVFAREGSDVIFPLFNAAGELAGASYLEEGLLVHGYLADADRALYARLRRAFPERSVRILDRDDASGQFALVVGGGGAADAIYHLDLEEGRASLIASTRPWLDDAGLSPVHVVRAVSVDGLEIEAFLTVPANARRPVPLVVNPHGGPIGVSDHRHFDPSVQFMASLGYAVLQVNFRGSEGYGKAFREAGWRNYGRLIEDDIDAALTATLAAHPIDAERMCVVGASYGGFSALVAGSRWPDRFRCIVSIAGLSDLPLFFTASDSSRDERVRELMRKLVGDPLEDLAFLQEVSPVYRHAQLSTPTLLIHGDEDLRVDYEHLRRMRRMLALAGRAPSVLTLEGEGHGSSSYESIEKTWGAVAGFLRLHLVPAVAARAP